MKPQYGSLICRTIWIKGHTINSVAKQLNINKELLRRWLIEDSLSVDLINNIGAIIVHDFSKDFPELFSGLEEETEDQCKDMPSPGYMDKYIQLLEKYNARLVEVIHKCRREHGNDCCR